MIYPYVTYVNSTENWRVQDAVGKYIGQDTGSLLAFKVLYVYAAPRGCVDARIDIYLPDPAQNKLIYLGTTSPYSGRPPHSFMGTQAEEVCPCPDTSTYYID